MAGDIKDIKDRIIKIGGVSYRVFCSGEFTGGKNYNSGEIKKGDEIVDKNQAPKGYYAVANINGCCDCEYTIGGDCKYLKDYNPNKIKFDCIISDRKDKQDVVFKKIKKDYEEVVEIEEQEVFGKEAFRFVRVKLLDNVKSVEDFEKYFYDSTGFILNGIYFFEDFIESYVNKVLEKFNKKYGKIPTFEEEYAKCERLDYVHDKYNYYLVVDVKTGKLFMGGTKGYKIMGLKYISKKDCEKLVEMSKKYKWKF